MVLKILCIIMILILLGILSVVIINVYMDKTTDENLLTLEECSNMEADCILVLGAGVAANGNPSWMLEDRILTSEELYNIHASKKIVMSGDHGREGYDEVNTMKNYAINDNIPSEDIFMDHAGFSTYDSLYRIKEIFGAKKIIIVTQEYHLTRALYIAKKLGLEAYGVAADKRDYLSMQRYREFREYIARTKDFLKVLYKPEPTYLGDEINLADSGDVTNDK